MTDASREGLERKIEGGSRNCEDFLSLGRLYLNAGDYASLITLYERSRPVPFVVSARARMLYDLGSAYYFIGDKERAIFTLDEAVSLLEKEKAEPVILYLRGLVGFKLFKIRGADPDRREHDLRYAKTALKTLVTRHSDFEETGTSYSHLAELSSLTGQFDEAAAYYRKAFERHRNSRDKACCMQGYADILREQKRLEEAKTAYDEALQVAAREEDLLSLIYYGRGLVLSDLGLKDEARASLLEAVRFRDKKPALARSMEYRTELDWALGKVAFDVRAYDDAGKHFKSVIESVCPGHPYYLAAAMLAGHCAYERSVYADAANWFGIVAESPLAKMRQKEQALRFLGAAFMRIDDLSQSIGAYMELLATTEDYHYDPGIYYDLAHAYQRLGYPEKSKICLLKVLECDPDGTFNVREKAKSLLAEFQTAS